MESIKNCGASEDAPCHFSAGGSFRAFTCYSPAGGISQSIHMLFPCWGRSVRALYLLLRNTSEGGEQGSDSCQCGSTENGAPANLRDHGGGGQHGHSGLTEGLQRTNSCGLHPKSPVTHNDVLSGGLFRHLVGCPIQHLNCGWDPLSCPPPQRGKDRILLSRPTSQLWAGWCCPR